jgi:hypothetical protein
MLINLISIALFSAWPNYLSIFFHCALHNPNVRFTLITNLDEHHSSWNENLGNITKPNNVILVQYTFETIKAEIQKENLGIGADLKLSSPYKLIDYKPMYGVLFQKELIGFSHWGWCDLDIFIGDIKATYECGYKNEDFLSYDSVNVHGPLMILRNTEFVNNFYLNMRSYPSTVESFRHSRTILFDELHMPYLIKRNSSAVLKTFHNQSRNCDASGIWMWYRGEMRNSAGPCVIFHFGGGGTKLSKRYKVTEWNRAKAFFSGGYHKSGDFGYGVARGKKIQSFSFVFTFTESKEFVVVNTTSGEDSDISRGLRKLMDQFKSIAANFHLPNSQCAL